MQIAQEESLNQPVVADTTKLLLLNYFKRKTKSSEQLNAIHEKKEAIYRALTHIQLNSHRTIGRLAEQKGLSNIDLAFGEQVLELHNALHRLLVIGLAQLLILGSLSQVAGESISQMRSVCVLDWGDSQDQLNRCLHKSLERSIRAVLIGPLEFLNLG